MSASYSYVKTIIDAPTLLTYISKTFSTITEISNEGGINVVLTFSLALTGPQQTTLAGLITAYADPIIGSTDEVNLSLFNRSNTALAANGVFTGTWEDVSRFSSVFISSYANVASATSGIQVQFGLISAQVDITRSFSAAAATAFVTSIAIPGRWMRLVYTNGTTLQTTFLLQARWSVGQLVQTGDNNSVIDDNLQTTLCRNLNMGRLDNSLYASIRADEDRRLRVRTCMDSAIGDTFRSTPLVQVAFLYSVNTEVVNTTLVSTGTVTYATGAAAVATAALANSSAIMSTRRYVSSAPGKVMRVIVSCAFTIGAANSVQMCGFGDTSNGLFIGYNGVAFGILTRNNSVDTWVAATAFNVDKLNGTGASAITLDPTKGNTYIIVYDTTGFGSVTFALASTAVGNVPEAITMHRVSFGNTGTATGLRLTSAPLMAAATNTTNATALTVRVSSLSAYVDSSVPYRIGRLRAVDIAKTISSTAYVPIITISNKSTYLALSNVSSIILTSISVSNDATKGSIIFAIYDSTSSTLTGTSYTDVSTATSVVQYDTAATSITNGVCMFSFNICKSGDCLIDLSQYDISVSPGMSITICGRCSSSNVSDGICVSLCWMEDA
jgi:hypothetical protein